MTAYYSRVGDRLVANRVAVRKTVTATWPAVIEKKSTTTTTTTEDRK